MKLRRSSAGFVALVSLLGGVHPARAVAGHYNIASSMPLLSVTQQAFTNRDVGPCNMTVYTASSNGVTGIDAAIIPIASEKHLTLTWSATGNVAKVIGGGLSGMFYSSDCRSIGLGVGFAEGSTTVPVPPGAAWLVVTSTWLYNVSIDVATSLA
jgi:hypothetical protein